MHTICIFTYDCVVNDTLCILKCHGKRQNQKKKKSGLKNQTELENLKIYILRNVCKTVKKVEVFFKTCNVRKIIFQKRSFSENVLVKNI